MTRYIFQCLNAYNQKVNGSILWWWYDFYEWEISPKCSKRMFHSLINVEITNAELFKCTHIVFWSLGFICKMACLEMTLYYEKKSEEIFTKFISFVKYLESLKPWKLLGPNIWRRSKSKNYWFYSRITKQHWKYDIHVIEKSVFKYVFHKVLINNYKWIFYVLIKKK